MQNRISIAGVFFILILAFLASCLDSSTNTTDVPSSFSITVNVQGIGSSQFDGQNRAVVEGVKFTLGNLELKRADSENITFDQTLLVANFSSGDTQDVVLGSGQLAGGTYNGFAFEMLPPGPSDQITDSDLVIVDDGGEISESFSIFISGTFNEEPFEYKTSDELNLDLVFEQMVDMPDTFGGMTVRLIPVSNGWFRDNDSSLINPADADSVQQQQINDNITQSFAVDVVVSNAAGSQ